MLLTQHGHPPDECREAAEDLQRRLESGNIFDHNFGLRPGFSGNVIGKMFGVLVVELPDGSNTYLAGFSGKIGGKNHYPGFVPPVFDSLAEDSFLNDGMRELKELSDQIAEAENQELVARLRNQRRLHSISLQSQLFRQYHFLNQYGESSSLTELFRNAGYRQPVSGAGECAGPKLLQYAFQNNMRPIAMAEFWWGLSPKTATWKHGQYYPYCREKCAPIMEHMLKGLS